jgi:hypothetical protein
LTPGVETATGSLGQGFGAGVAIAEAYLSARQQLTRFEIINQFDLSRPRIGQAFREDGPTMAHTARRVCRGSQPISSSDYFGAPNFERIDAKGTFYTGWETK